MCFAHPSLLSFASFALLRESFFEISNFRSEIVSVQYLPVPNEPNKLTKLPVTAEIQNPKSKIQNRLGFPDFPDSCII